MRKLLLVLGWMINPLTWIAGVACLSIAAFHVSTARGFCILGVCLLATPIAPRLIRLLVAHVQSKASK